MYFTKKNSAIVCRKNVRSFSLAYKSRILSFLTLHIIFMEKNNIPAQPLNLWMKQNDHQNLYTHFPLTIKILEIWTLWHNNCDHPTKWTVFVFFKPVMCVKIQMEWRTVLILIRLLLEQPDLDLHYLRRSICLRSKNFYNKINMFKLRITSVYMISYKLYMFLLKWHC